MPAGCVAARCSTRGSSFSPLVADVTCPARDQTKIGVPSAFAIEATFEDSNLKVRSGAPEASMC